MDFAIAKMGSDDLVLGLQWLKLFNPLIDWRKRVLNLGREQIPIFQEYVV